MQSVNPVGLSRRGFSEEAIKKIKNAFKLLYVKRGIVMEQAMEELRNDAKNSDDVAYLVRFIENSRSGIVR